MGSHGTVRTVESGWGGGCGAAAAAGVVPAGSAVLVDTGSGMSNCMGLGGEDNCKSPRFGSPSAGSVLFWGTRRGVQSGPQWAGAAEPTGAPGVSILLGKKAKGRVAGESVTQGGGGRGNEAPSDG